MDYMIADIKNKIGSKRNIDAALVVLKRNDYRNNIQDIYAIKTISRMLDNSHPDNVFMILTHCDIERPSEKFI